VQSSKLHQDIDAYLHEDVLISIALCAEAIRKFETPVTEAEIVRPRPLGDTRPVLLSCRLNVVYDRTSGEEQQDCEACSGGIVKLSASHRESHVPRGACRASCRDSEFRVYSFSGDQMAENGPMK
jgi:hypothetical protein